MLAITLKQRLKTAVALLAVCVLGSLSACIGVPQAAFVSGVRQAEPARAQQQLAAVMRTAAQAGFTGAVLVGDASRVLHQSAYGALKLGGSTPLANDSVARLASITKQFTAVLVMQQVQAGRMALDQPLGNYWPDYPNASTRAVTIRQLLMHTSGVPKPTETSAFYVVNASNPPDMARAASSTCAAPLVAKPGERFEYNNCDYLILGALLERLTQQPYAALLKTAIFEPAGMQAAGVYGAITPGIEQHAHGSHEEPPQARVFDATVNPAHYGAGGAAFGTLADVWAFNKAFANGALLGNAAKAEMTRPNAWGAALGVWVYELALEGGRKAAVVERQGWIGGVRWVNLLDIRSNTSVIVMSTRAELDLSQTHEGKDLGAQLLRAALSAPVE